MGNLKTYLAGALLIAGLAAPASANGGFPISPSQRANTFAYCAGAYMALAEHSALFDGTAAQIAQDRRTTFAQMLDAVTPDAVQYGLPQAQITAQRVQARADLRALLSAAEFNMIPERARPARAAAQAAFGRCDALLLGV